MATRVKICGIMNPDDAAAAVGAGADAVGFVLYRKSPRYVEPQMVKAIVASLPPLVVPVGVFVNEEPKVVRDLMDSCGLALAQLHGDESAGYCETLGRPVIKAIGIKDRASLLALAEYKGRAQVRGLLLDAFAPDTYGGTGQTINWTIAAEIAKSMTVILAGGLTPENVAAAVAAVRPHAVDVSSGVETSPGQKDHGRIVAFVQAAKLASA
ncbi:MAG: phosphoribosylanthranilate isomerase [Nitrospiraceae bacterium]